MLVLVITIKLTILILLLYGCYTDMKWRHVSNKISFSIAALALILFNPDVLGIKGAFIIFLIFSWSFNPHAKKYLGSKLIGSADIKVLIPLILSFAAIPLIMFIAIFCSVGVTIGLLKGRKYTIPGFIPITTAYLFSLF